jgi:hypothetical protein
MYVCSSLLFHLFFCLRSLLTLLLRRPVAWIVQGHAYMKPSYPHPSLCITRNLTSLSDGLQTYVPHRFLRGLLPDALLEEYVFWQESDDSLTGYLIKEVRDKRAQQTVLRVELLRDKNSLSAVGRVSRRPLKGLAPGAAYEELPQHPVFLKKHAELERERALIAAQAKEQKEREKAGGAAADGDAKSTTPVKPVGFAPGFCPPII